MLMADIGFRFGRRTRAKLTEYDGANLRTLQSSLLWLMGLLLAFAFSMAAARHKANQEMVFREATLLHAILMDARMLRAPQRDRLHQLLKQVPFGPTNSLLSPTQLGEELDRVQPPRRALAPTGENGQRAKEQKRQDAEPGGAATLQAMPGKKQTIPSTTRKSGATTETLTQQA